MLVGYVYDNCGCVWVPPVDEGVRIHAKLVFFNGVISRAKIIFNPSFISRYIDSWSIQSKGGITKRSRFLF